MRRIIPCLDIKQGRVVKGVRFVNLADAGDPVTLARAYEARGADELVFLDITATLEGRRAMLDVVRAVAAELTIPFAVGGGVGRVDDVRDLLRAGCDKVSVNSAAVRDPALLTRAADEFGSQCVVVAIDARRRVPSEGAGEILLTSIDADGTKQGFDVELTRAVRDAVDVPVIASGGAGAVSHFVDIFTAGQADAALAASLFHYGQLDIGDLKRALAERGVPVRPLEYLSV